LSKINNKIDAIILCGGYGTRIKNFTKNIIPKSLLKIKKRTFLDYLLKKITKYPFNKIILIAGYQGKKIYKIYNNKRINLIEIECLVEKKPSGTGGALNFAKNKIQNDFVLFNGDTFIDFNLGYFLKKKFNKKYIGEMILTSNSSKSLTNNLLNLRIKKNKVINFSDKTNLINSGIIFFKKKIKKEFKKNVISFENTILKKLINKNKIVGKIDSNFFVDIGTDKNFLYAKQKIPALFNKPALFLDRDGVINKDFGHVHSIDKLVYNKKIFSIIKKYQKKKYLTFVVTNQAGIAKGFYSLNSFFKFQNFIKKDLFNRDIYINDQEFCPHHPNGVVKKYSIICKCRKPGNQMIKNLRERWDIDLKKSLFIGDHKVDELCAKKSKIKFKYFNKKK
jgi:D-glycero-D-manno-heptose 1,7-bisphosphate phosphatase